MKLINLKSFLVFVLIAAINCGIATAQVADSGTLTLAVIPIYNLSVNISSAANNFGVNIPLGSSRTICVGNIGNDGNIISKWQKRTAAVTQSAGTAWTLKTSGNPGTDEFRLLAVSTGMAVVPDYCGGGTANDSCIEGAHDTIGVTDSFTDLTEGGNAGPTMYPGETRKLWTSIMMPPVISSGNEQTITLSIRAVLP